MKTKKVSLFLVCAIFIALMLLAVCACGSSKGPSAETRVTLENVASASDKATIEKNISSIFGVSVTLPTGSLSAEATTIESLPVYKITVSNSTESCYSYYQTIYASQETHGWTWVESEGLFVKTVSDTKIALGFQTESEQATSYDIFVLFMPASEDPSDPSDHSDPDDPTVSSINISSEPKTNYLYGEELDYSGIVVTMVMSDESEQFANLDDLIVDTECVFNSQVAGTYTITVALSSDSTITDSYDVTVSLSDLTNIFANEVEITYCASPTNIFVGGLPDEATVTYSMDAGETKTYSADNPEFTDAGEYTVYYKVSKSGYNDYLGSSTVTIRPAAFAENSIVMTGYNGDYDGESHSTTEATFPDGATVAYNTDGGTEYGLPACPTYTNAGTYTVYYKVSKANYTDKTGQFVITINALTFDGITADNVTEIASDAEYSIKVNGTQSGDTVYYRENATDEWSETEIKKSTAGEHVIYYRVVRDANHCVEGNATLSLIPNVALTGVQVSGGTYTWLEDISRKITSSNFTGVEDDDIIYYSTDNETWSSTAPSFVEPSSSPYKTYVRIMRKNVGYLDTSADITINKATYTRDTYSPFSYTTTWTEGMTFEDISKETSFPTNIYFVEPDSVVTAGTTVSSANVRYYDSDTLVYYNADPAHYENYTVNIKLTIKRKPLAEGEIVISDTEVTYDGNPHALTVSGTNVSAYNVVYSYSGNSGATMAFTDAMEGGYTVDYEITRKVNTDYYETYCDSANVIINRADYTGISHEPIVVTYSETQEVYGLRDMDLSDIELDEHFNWTDSVFTKVNVGTTTMNITYSDEPDGKDNYNTLSLTVDLTVNPATITDIDIEDMTRVYTGQNQSFFTLKSYLRTDNDVITDTAYINISDTQPEESEWTPYVYPRYEFTCNANQKRRNL